MSDILENFLIGKIEASRIRLNSATESPFNAKFICKWKFG